MAHVLFVLLNEVCPWLECFNIWELDRAKPSVALSSSPLEGQSHISTLDIELPW
jgi:hypothetical protein